MSGRARQSGEWLFYGGRLLDAPRASRTTPGGARASRRGSTEALWVRGGRIEAVGPLRDLRRRVGRSAEAVDLAGGTVTPGFVDSHIHLLAWIRAVEETWLGEGQTEASLARAVRAADRAAPPGEWIRVRGWVPREWPAERRTRATLDRLAPDRPLIVYAVDGHSVWVNTAALAGAGVALDAADPRGGRVERDRTGPTGVLIETAADWIHPHVARGRAVSGDLRRAIARLRGLGITTAHSYDRSAVWAGAQELERAGGLGFRILLSVPHDSLDAAAALGLAGGFGSARLRVGPVKMFADGTLGSATALLEEPYEGSGQRGLERMSVEALREGCLAAARAGLPVAIHAIGDRAVRNALDAIESVARAGARFPAPPRVEHVQLVRPEDLPRFRALGVVASVQPIHQVTDREVARRSWGGRTTRSYAWRSLLRSGATLVFGSDAPFDRPGPLLGVQAALLRREAGEPDERTFHPEQRIGLAQALRAHMESPHRLAGFGVPLGRLAVGWGADLVRFSEDLAMLDPGELHRVRAGGVWVEGALVQGS